MQFKKITSHGLHLLHKVCGLARAALVDHSPFHPPPLPLPLALSLSFLSLCFTAESIRNPLACGEQKYLKTEHFLASTPPRYELCAVLSSVNL